MFPAGREVCDNLPFLRRKRVVWPVGLHRWLLFVSVLSEVLAPSLYAPIVYAKGPADPFLADTQGLGLVNQLKKDLSLLTRHVLPLETPDDS